MSNVHSKTTTKLTRTCTQPLLELATVSAVCGQVPAPISGRARCVWSSWHLQTLHPSDHCDLVAHSGAHNSPTQLALAHAAVPMLSAPTNAVSKRVRGYKELPSVCGSMQTAHIAQNQQSGAAHSRLPTSNTNRAQRKVQHRAASANGSCRTAQLVGRNLLLLQENHVPK